MLHFDATAVQLALPWGRLIPALRQAFIQGCTVPARHPHAIGPQGTALLMPAWREGGCLGVKTVTIFPSAADIKKLSSPDAVPQDIRRVQTRIFTSFKANTK